MKTNLFIAFIIAFLICSCKSFEPPQEKYTYENLIGKTKKVEVYFFTNPGKGLGAPIEISRVKRDGFIVINRKERFLRNVLTSLTKLEEDTYSLEDFWCYMYFEIFYKNGRKDKLAIGRNDRIILNGKTYKANPEIAKELVTCLPYPLAEFWIDRYYKNLLCL
jgi:hypothetical protein